MNARRLRHDDMPSFVRRTGPVLLAFSVLLFALQVLAQRTSSEPRRTLRDKQTHFGAEEPIKRPIKIPKAVLQMLKQDERVQQCLQDAADQEPDLASWFTASIADLNDDHQPDLVVKPEKACL